MTLHVLEDLPQSVLAAARQRDAAADALDADADRLERELDLAHLLSPTLGDTYGSDWPARRRAVLERAIAKAQRTSSHDDLVAVITHYAGARVAEGA